MSPHTAGQLVSILIHGGGGGQRIFLFFFVLFVFFVFSKFHFYLNKKNKKNKKLFFTNFAENIPYKTRLALNEALNRICNDKS